MKMYEKLRLKPPVTGGDELEVIGGAPLVNRGRVRGIPQDWPNDGPLFVSIAIARDYYLRETGGK